MKTRCPVRGPKRGVGGKGGSAGNWRIYVVKQTNWSWWAADGVQLLEQNAPTLEVDLDSRQAGCMLATGPGGHTCARNPAAARSNGSRPRPQPGTSTFGGRSLLFCLQPAQKTLI